MARAAAGSGADGAVAPDFAPISASSEPTTVPSMCMNCHSEDATTTLLLTSIPFFPSLLISSVSCPACHYTDSSTMPTTPLPALATATSLTVDCVADLSRTVLLSDFSCVSIPDVELEIPARGGKGARLTTVEGIVQEVIDSLAYGEKEREEAEPSLGVKVAQFVAKLDALRDFELRQDPWTLVIDDISGRSMIESNKPGKDDPRIAVRYYRRDNQANAKLGLPEEQPSALESSPDPDAPNGEIGSDEVVCIPESCPACSKLGEVRMKLTDIPHFKSVLILAFSCDFCGYKSSEVKPGSSSSSISSKARKTTFRVTCPDDLSRDILKSDTAAMSIPEIELELAPGTLGGRFSTIEGILRLALRELQSVGMMSGASLGDSADRVKKNAFSRLFVDMEGLLTGDKEFTVELSDVAGNSYIQNLYAPDDDPEMVVEERERTREENEELGLIETASSGSLGVIREGEEEGDESADSAEGQ